MSMEKLPADLLSKIFIRLLAKQVAQMRCVSKSWNALLSHPSFVKSHLHHSINNNDQILLVFYEETSSSDPRSFTAHPCGSTHLELTNFIKFPPVNPNSGDIIRVIGSVHGLICYRYGYDVIHIWNPSLSAVSTLPPPFLPSFSGDDSYNINFRFGFDPKTEDYKVVKLIGLTGTSSYLIKEWLQVEVYSMKKGSWEFITQRFPSHFTKNFEDDFVCVDGHDGHLHWVGSIDKKEGPQTIVAFDLSSETFREIPFPDSLLDGDRLNILGVLGGKLSVMSWYVNEDDDYGTYEMWVMEEYGMVESWVKRHSFSRIVSNVVAFAFTSHNGFLILDYDRHIFLYDPATHKTKILEKPYHGAYCRNKIVEYVDSLVWVAPVKNQMLDGAEQN